MRRSRALSRNRARSPGPLALSGTPGTGKSAVARRLGARVAREEVSELALRLGAGRRRGPGVEVDLGRIDRELRKHPIRDDRVLVGHLAHLLPVRDVVLLRCHPAELDRRLRRARRGGAAERRENVAAEAVDVVLSEAVALGRRIWEIDTTGRTVGAVAREVERRWRLRGPERYGRVDWLSDPAVTRLLLRGG